MTNVLKKIWDNKILSLFVLALILICSFYGCKSVIAHADESNEPETSEVAWASDEEGVENSDDEAPLEAYGYKSERFGQNVLVLKYDRTKQVQIKYRDIYDIPTSATQASDWPWDNDRDQFDFVDIDDNFKNYSELTSTAYMFYNFDHARVRDLNGFKNLNTSNVTNMSNMFNGFGSSSFLDIAPNISNWDTSKVTDTSYMFANYGQNRMISSLDLSSFNTSEVTNFTKMLIGMKLKSITLGADFNLYLGPSGACLTNSSGYYQDTAWYSVDGTVYPKCSFPPRERNTTYYDCFNEAYGYWEGDSLILKYDQYRGRNLSSYNTYDIPTSASQASDWQWDRDRETFKKIVIDESFKNYSGLKSTAYMFQNFKNVSEHEGFQNLNTENVTNMSHMFDNYGSLSGTLSTPPDVSHWNTSNVIDMSYMFESYAQSSGCVNTTPDVSHWNTSNVTNMKWMFWMYGRNCIFPCLNLESFSMGKVTNYERMLAVRVKSIKLGRDINIEFGNPGACLTNSSDDWNRTWYSEDGVECPQCTIPPRESTTTYYDAAPVPYGYKDGNKLTITYDPEINTHEKQGQKVFDIRNEKAKSLWYWEYYKDEITEVSIEDNFKHFHGLTSTAFMFQDLWNVNKIEGCENIDTSNVTSMKDMFCRFGQASTSLYTVPNVSYWNTSNVTDMSYMFFRYGASSNVLDKTPDVSRWDTSRVTNTRSMFENYGEDRVFKLDLSNWDTSNITDRKNYDNMLCDCRLWSITLGEKFDLVLGADWYCEHSACICDSGKGRSNEWHDVYGNWYSPKYFGKEKRTAPKTYYDIYTRTTSTQKNLRSSCMDKSQDSINKNDNVNIQNSDLNKSQIKQNVSCKGNIEAKANSLNKRRQKVGAKCCQQDKPTYTDNKAKDNSLYKRRQAIPNIKI